MRPERSTASRLAAFALLALAALALLAAGGSPAFAEDAPSRYGKGWLKMPPNESKGLGDTIDHVFMVILWLTGVVFVGVQAALVWFLFRYRERKDGGDRKIVYSHGSNSLEFFWTAVPAIIVLVLAIWSEKYWAESRKIQPENAHEVKVMGRQFNWQFLYPGPNGKYGDADDIQSSVLYLEADKPTIFTIVSLDVLHSFFLPDFRLKQDAMPGSEIRVWVTPKRPGKFEIACAEFCGVSHGQMRGQLEVLTKKDYEAKLDSLKGVRFF
jgi:cytochrome c oxidase subunit 2